MFRTILNLTYGSFLDCAHYFGVHISPDGKISAHEVTVPDHEVSVSEEPDGPHESVSVLGWATDHEVSVSEEPDGAIKLKTSSDHFLVVQPYLTRKEVNG